jgi:hypothetical protein
MTSRALSDTRPVPRRGLSREEAAMYIAMSPSNADGCSLFAKMLG